MRLFQWREHDILVLIYFYYRDINANICHSERSRINGHMVLYTLENGFICYGPIGATGNDAGVFPWLHSIKAI